MPKKAAGKGKFPFPPKGGKDAKMAMDKMKKGKMKPPKGMPAFMMKDK